MHDNFHDFIFSSVKLASLSVDKLFSFRETYLFQFIFIPKHSFFLSQDVEKLDVAGGTRKEKYSLSGKVRATVLLGSFNQISRVFSAENPAPRLRSSDVRQAFTFD